jgi:hypothetical protein
MLARRRITLLAATSTVCSLALVIASAGPAAAAATVLSDNAEQASTKVSEDLRENWSFSTRTPYWSILAVLPPPFWDTIADVGFDGSGFVRGNANGITGANFVAIDSNSGRRPFGSYYGRAIPLTPPPDWPGGLAPTYRIVFAQGSNILRSGSTTITWNGTAFIAVRDLLLFQGQRVTITVDPADMAYLLASDPANSSTWIEPRDSAAAHTDLGVLQYVAPRAAWYGVVVVNRRGLTSSAVQVTIT